jgi:RNA polymerase sigma-70 factor, ECF subfamily
MVSMEATLLNRARAYDLDALAQIHQTYYPAVLRYITYRISDQDTAEDLTSEVFTRLMNALTRTTTPQHTLRGWLFGVASRVVSDYYRQHYRSPRRVELTDAIPLMAADPSDEVAAHFIEEKLRRAIAELTEEQQNVINLRFGYGLPTQDVACQMGKSEGAVKQLQSRAIANLSRKLQPQLAM